MSDGKDIDAVMSRIDAFVNDPKKLPYYGWHNDNVATYKSVIQQDRVEYEEFLRRIIEMKLGGLAVQIGLGFSGGAHFALRQIFERVVSIDFDASHIAHFKSYYTLDPQRDLIVHGNSANPQLVEGVRSTIKGADLLFIDGGHLFTEVRADWENFHTIVRPGGIVSFHDSVPMPHRYDIRQVDVFLSWLEHQPFKPPKIERIGSRYGIAYYVVP